MQKKLLSWFLSFCLAVFFTGIAAQGQEVGSRPPGLIKVAKVTGAVTAVKDGVTTPLANGSEISQGYVVNTAKDSSVVLVFSNGATVNLAQDSSLSIDEFLQDPFADEVAVSKLTSEPSVSNTKLSLSRGELVGNVKKLNYDAGSSFNVQTPVGAAGIRGTTFRIIFRPDGTGKAFFSLTTVEGNVVLASGTVNMPAEVAVPDNREVEVVLDVSVDAATGTVTVSAPATTPVTVTVTPPTTQAQVAAVAQQVAEVVATVVFAPPAPTQTPPPTQTNTQQESSEEEDSGQSQTPGGDTPPPSNQTPPTTTPPTTTPPPATPPPPRTTSGDGRTS